LPYSYKNFFFVFLRLEPSCDLDAADAATLRVVASGYLRENERLRISNSELNVHAAFRIDEVNLLRSEAEGLRKSYSELSVETEKCRGDLQRAMSDLFECQHVLIPALLDQVEQLTRQAEVREALLRQEREGNIVALQDLRVRCEERMLQREGIVAGLRDCARQVSAVHCQEMERLRRELRSVAAKLAFLRDLCMRRGIHHIRNFIRMTVEN
jgi:hypothetical protein